MQADGSLPLEQRRHYRYIHILVQLLLASENFKFLATAEMKHEFPLWICDWLFKFLAEYVVWTFQSWKTSLWVLVSCGRNALHALQRIVKEEGVLRLWRGAGPTVTRAMAVTLSISFPMFMASLTIQRGRTELSISDAVSEDGPAHPGAQDLGLPVDVHWCYVASCCFQVNVAMLATYDHAKEVRHSQPYAFLERSIPWAESRCHKLDGFCFTCLRRFLHWSPKSSNASLFLMSMSSRWTSVMLQIVAHPAGRLQYLVSLCWIITVWKQIAKYEGLLINVMFSIAGHHYALDSYWFVSYPSGVKFSRWILNSCLQVRYMPSTREKHWV